MAVPSVRLLVCLSVCLSCCDDDDWTFVQYVYTRKHSQSVHSHTFSISLDCHTLIMITCIFDSFGSAMGVFVVVELSDENLQWCQLQLLTVLGWRDQCQLLYHKWWCVSSSWWNTQSLAAGCRSRDAWLDSVNIYFWSCSYCTIDILHYIGFCYSVGIGSCPSVRSFIRLSHVANVLN